LVNWIGDEGCREKNPCRSRVVQMLQLLEPSQYVKK